MTRLWGQACEVDDTEGIAFAITTSRPRGIVNSRVVNIVRIRQLARDLHEEWAQLMQLPGRRMVLLPRAAPVMSAGQRDRRYSYSIRFV